MNGQSRREYAAAIGAQAHWLSAAIAASADLHPDTEAVEAVDHLYDLARTHGQHEVVTEPREA